MTCCWNSQTREWRSTALIVGKAEGRARQVCLVISSSPIVHDISMIIPGAMNNHIQAKRVHPGQESTKHLSAYCA